MIDQATRWIQQNTLPNSGIIVSSRQRVAYPEVTGYFIPTLQTVGEHQLASQYANWLTTVQLPDGSFGSPDGRKGFAFDTGQVIRGWVSLLHKFPELERPLRRACDWLINTADTTTGRLLVPSPGSDWSLGARGEVNEGIHLYSLGPLRLAGDLLGEKHYLNFVDKSLSYYLSTVDLTSFESPNALTHFFAYIQEALIELGYEDIASKGMSSVSRFQQANGAVPGYSNVTWVCSTGLAQLAKVWYHLGERMRADKALEFLSMLQNPGGGFFGSYGVQADYFPAAEISWAVKYTIEAVQLQIAHHFNYTAEEYRKDISEQDGRVRAVLQAGGNLNGKRILDAGCGKGRYSKLLQSLFPSALITAMDVSIEMLRAVPPGIATIQSGILNMPFADDSFDLVLCVEALEHVVQIDAGIKELTRVVAPGGKLVVIDKNKEKIGALDMPSWETWFGCEELRTMMQGYGLETTAEFISYDDRRVPDGLFVCWVGAKGGTVPVQVQVDFQSVSEVSSFHDDTGCDERLKFRLAIIPSDAMDAYRHKSSGYIAAYFNPDNLFEEVFCLSPLETEERVEHGIHIIPTEATDFKQRVIDLRIDVVRAYGGYWACDFACNNRPDRVPVIVSVHDTNPELLYDSILFADQVWVVSHAVQRLVERKGVARDKIRIRPNWVDFGVFHRFTDKSHLDLLKDMYPARYRILHVGRKVFQKNLDTLIRALAILGDDYCCIFAGPGDCRPFEELAESIGVRHRCHFIDSIPHEDLPQYYSLCDCMCTPSRWEGFGMVFIEALACRSVVVTSDLAPMNEYIYHGYNGLLVSAFENPACLAETIKISCTDQSKRRHLQANASASVGAFCREKLQCHEAGLYREVLRQQCTDTISCWKRSSSGTPYVNSR